MVGGCERVQKPAGMKIQGHGNPEMEAGIYGASLTGRQ
jgi:hypothetical protein